MTVTGCQIPAAIVDALAEFEVEPARGFLPSPDPLERLPAPFEPWEDIAHDLPKLLVARRVRPVLDRLPILLPRELTEARQHRRAMLLLSFLGHAYVWGDPEPADRLPSGIAVPWHTIAQRLGRPPVLSYASYALENWRRLDPEGPIALGNIVLLQNFLGGLDEEWFILVHVEIEARAAPALAAILHAQKAMLQDQVEECHGQLAAIPPAIHSMWETLLRMPESCDPYVYYNRVRPYIHGWKDHPGLPAGVIYEGVEAYGGHPQKFRGETGAQSSIIPCLDAALGIEHKEDVLRRYLREMREYMPSRHRAFIEAIEQGPSIRQYVLDRTEIHPGLRDAYNASIHWLERFRSTHLEYAKSYIQKQKPTGPNNPVEVGTGGTPFIDYLKKHRDETGDHTIS